jgi:hypothetical protein
VETEAPAAGKYAVRQFPVGSSTPDSQFWAVNSTSRNPEPRTLSTSHESRITMSRTLHIIIAVTTLTAAVLVLDSWRAARKNSLQLAAALASQNALIEQASANEQQRNKDLAAALASIAEQKKQVRTPQQALDAIPSILPPLPLPIGISLPNLTEDLKPGETPSASINVPQPDLKPLYDALQDCRACALERDAAKKDLADEQAQLAALTRERNAAVAAAHGGNFWSRLKQATKWFAIGVAAGAVAAAASHH